MFEGTIKPGKRTAVVITEALPGAADSDNDRNALYAAWSCGDMAPNSPSFMRKELEIIRQIWIYDKMLVNLVFASGVDYGRVVDLRFPGRNRMTQAAFGGLIYGLL